MFHHLKQRVTDVGTVKQLCLQAEKHALRDEQREPGAEHFLLAALDLPDGTARRAFERVAANPSDLEGAIAGQYADALATLGFGPDIADGIADAPEALTSKEGLYRAAPSGQAMMQELAAGRRFSDRTPFVGAHVVATVAEMRHGVAARALRAMGIDPTALKSAALAEIDRLETE